jgi:hypothetical protein
MVHQKKQERQAIGHHMCKTTVGAPWDHKGNDMQKTLKWFLSANALLGGAIAANASGYFFYNADAIAYAGAYTDTDFSSLGSDISITTTETITRSADEWGNGTQTYQNTSSSTSTDFRTGSITTENSPQVGSASSYCEDLLQIVLTNDSLTTAESFTATSESVAVSNISVVCGSDVASSSGSAFGPDSFAVSQTAAYWATLFTYSDSPTGLFEQTVPGVGSVSIVTSSSETFSEAISPGGNISFSQVVYADSSGYSTGIAPSPAAMLPYMIGLVGAMRRRKKPSDG